MRILERIFRKVKSARNQILVLIDLENILTNVPFFPPGKFSIERALENLMGELAQEIGPIIGVYVFVPPHLASAWGDMLKRQRFFIIFCPKMIDKTKSEKDDVDGELIRFGMEIIDQMPDITHLCLVSGDRDFIPLLQEARYHGVRNIIAAGDLRSLSEELISFAEKDPKNPKKRRVYLLSDMGN